MTITFFAFWCTASKNKLLIASPSLSFFCKSQFWTVRNNRKETTWFSIAFTLPTQFLTLVNSVKKLKIYIFLFVSNELSYILLNIFLYVVYYISILQNITMILVLLEKSISWTKLIFPHVFSLTDSNLNPPIIFFRLSTKINSKNETFCVIIKVTYFVIR